ncbi:D-2-hydroxyacid dehydrogenase [Vibrio scophthalmi]|uniref:D-2-hydroxyacid dehydrogenase n=1 Tax=Vibrio scophthalmi TaxID=45658 RepID=UPI0022840DEE|nr:D-2-hydroxyacid dehydrogenase [Vibrio scophthalmi]MCY9805257.1 D-2-hydroxyacid dehydrogenase [Vibrio scophthalmi]
MDNLTKKLYILTDADQIYQELIEKLALPNLIITNQRNEADILLAAPPRLATQLDDFTNITWVQSTYAGVDALINHSLRQDYLLTNVKGIFGQQIAEYVLGFTIEHYRHFKQYQQQQTNKQWRPAQYQCLNSKTLAIVGTGEIGTHLAQVAKAFAMRTIGINTSGIPKPGAPFDETYHVDELASAIAQSNIVVNTLPDTARTRGLFNQAAFARAKDILLFNVGRGSSIDQTALLDALNHDKIEHAFLDVFEQEPLSAEHPYWSHPKITITPHIAALSFPEQVVDIFTQHYINWEQGYTLHDCIDFSKGY